MKSLNEIKELWNENKDHEAGTGLLNKEAIKAIIKSRIKREKKIVMEYFWASFVYQNLIYSFSTYLIIKYWGNAQIMLLTFVGILLYIPFTVILLKKFKKIALLTVNKVGAPVQDMQENVKSQSVLLSGFFRFKKRFDLVSVPVSCFLIVVIIFKLWVRGGVEGHFIGGLICYLLVLSVFIIATYAENKKRFKNPLRQLQLILEDIKTTGDK